MQHVVLGLLVGYIKNETLLGWGGKPLHCIVMEFQFPGPPLSGGKKAFSPPQQHRYLQRTFSVIKDYFKSMWYEIIKPGFISRIPCPWGLRNFLPLPCFAS
jgi:hypothetical protein